MATPVPRQQDERYLNWLRDSVALLTLKEGLEYFTDKRVSDFHEELHTEVPKPYSKNGPLDPLNFKQQAVPCVQICKTCSHNEVERHHHTWRVRCPSKVCNTWMKHILQYHIDGPNCDIAKSNLKPQLWPSHPWEVAKCFLPYGCHRIISAKDADVAALLKLLSRCCFMYRYMNEYSLIEELLAIRHGLMHSNTLVVSDNQLKQHTEKMVQFLKALEDLSQLETETIQRTIDTIRKLQSKATDIPPNKEVDALGARMLALDSELESLRTQCRVYDQTRLDLNRTSDEMQSLSEDFIKTKSAIDKLEETKDRFEKFLKDNDLVKDMSRLSTRLQQHEQMLDQQDFRLDMLERHIRLPNVTLLKTYEHLTDNEAKRFKLTEPLDLLGHAAKSKPLVGLFEKNLAMHVPVQHLTVFPAGSPYQQELPLKTPDQTQDTECATANSQKTQDASENEQKVVKLEERVDHLEETVKTVQNRVNAFDDTKTGVTDTSNANIAGEEHFKEPVVTQDVGTTRASMHNAADSDAEFPFRSTDGRLRELPKDCIERLMKQADRLAKGAFGKTFVVKGHTLCKYRLVIKKIRCKDKDDNRLSAIKEMLASRLKHQGIVPLLAMTWDINNQVYYFVMPFMEKGDLNKAIEDDRTRCNNGECQILNKQIRLKILMQLAAVLMFLHTGVKYFREPYVHADITSKNIVLDINYNMRLLDFGLSKEIKGYRSGTTRKSSNKSGTDGYRAPSTTGELSKQTDIFSYGVVALELITGQPPVIRPGKYLHNEDVLTYREREIKHIWVIDKVEDSVTEALVRMAEKCKKQTITAKQIIKDYLEPILRTGGIEHFDYTVDDSMCTLCMTNPIVKSDILKHRSCKPRICVTCIRNSYLNPLTCPMCQADLNSPIGNGWGAILIAGNDVNNPALAQSFKTDVEMLRNAITSKRQASMRISNADVKVVQPYETGKPDALTPKLEIAIADLMSKEHIQTLMIYFTGHADNYNLMLGKVEETLKEEDIFEMFSRYSGGTQRIQKVIAIIDCCQPNTATKDVFKGATTIIKLTACRTNEYANTTLKNGSLFTTLLVECLSGEEAKTKCSYSKNYNLSCTVCQDDLLFQKCADGFLSLDYLNDYIGRHMEEAGCDPPNLNLSDADWRATKIAFFMPKLPPIEINSGDTKVYKTLRKLPENITDLFNDPQRVTTDNHIDQRLLVKYFKEIFAIVVKTGSRVQPTIELLTLEQIESAWNGLCKLYILPRDIHLIHLNRSVGIFLHEPANSALVIECCKQQWKDECNIEKTHDALLIDIPVQGLQSIENNVSRSIKSDSKLRGCFRVLKDELLDDISSSEFKDKDWRLVMKFPYQDTEEVVEEKFFIVCLKSNENSLAELS